MPLDPQMQAVLDQLTKFGAPPIENSSPEIARSLPTFKNAVEEMVAENAAMRSLCNAAEYIVVSVAYRQAPEHKYPAPVDDAYMALQSVMANAGNINGDPTRVAVGGESAGANLATVACLKARAEGGHMPISQLLIYPVTDSAMNTPSYQENAHAKPLNAAMMSWFWHQYLENESQEREPYAAPMYATDLSGLPRATVLTAEFDPLRDEGEAYARRLLDAGVPVFAKRYGGVTHEFFGLAGAVPKAKQAVEDAAKALKEAFALQGEVVGSRPIAPVSN